MNKTNFDYLFKLKSQYELLNEQIYELECAMYSPKKNSGNEYVKGGIKKDFSDYIIKLDELIKKREAKWDELINERDRLAKEITTLSQFNQVEYLAILEKV